MTQYYLAQIDLYNWGPFSGRQPSVTIHPEGTAIVGATGSGKTTLVDALMTLLAERPRYNLASTGGIESDRDLMSYMRGVSGVGNADSNDHVSRQGQTITGISATFLPVPIKADDPKNAKQNDKQNAQTTKATTTKSNDIAGIQIATVMWIDSNSTAASDRKDVWLVQQFRNDNNKHDSENSSDENAHQQLLITASLNLDNWLSHIHEEGIKSFKKHSKNTPQLQLFDTKKAYLANVCRFFEINKTAFTLLNRAAGLKQLSNIDDIFRDFVLDDNAAFNRAIEVANEFEDLKAIRAELETAKAQQRSLSPIATLNEQLKKQKNALDDLQKLLDILPVWFACIALDVWQQQDAQLAKQQEKHQQQLEQLNHKHTRLHHQIEHLNQQYMQLGGDQINAINKQIQLNQSLLAKVEQDLQHYQQIAASLGFEQADNLTANRLKEQQDWARSKRKETQAELDAQTLSCNELNGQVFNQKHAFTEIKTELADAKKLTSNIPAKFQHFREALAQQLSLHHDDLPFVAELIAVKQTEQDWRGAIERALGSQRLRLLVPQDAMQTALKWVNERHNNLHVRLVEADPHSSANAQFFEDGFTRKLDFKKHAFANALKHILAGIDRHCVADTNTLQHTPHAMTMQGLMSGKSGYFDKQDQRRLDADWLTGFDNKDRVAMLSEKVKQTQDTLTKTEMLAKNAQQTLKNTQTHINFLEKLIQTDFNRIDVAPLTLMIQQLNEQLAALNDPTSDVAKTKQQLENTHKEQQTLTDAIIDQKANLQSLHTKQNEIKTHITACIAKKGAGLSAKQHEFARVQINAQFKPSKADTAWQNLPPEQMVQQELDANKLLNHQLKKQQEKYNDLVNKTIRQMGEAHNHDTGALAEAGKELQDMPVYLAQLNRLNEEDLPNKQQRFMDYLNTSSDQGVTQLLTDIDNHVEVIKTRVGELNETLKRVDFQPNRYLQLNPNAVVHQSIKDIEKARKYLRTATLKDDAGETRYQALSHLIKLLRQASDNKRSLASKSLLDPRYRLSFSVSVIDRQTDAVIETRTGSQGGSGGEKEIIASYILTASLSYALCPAHARLPRFSSIVLDEAFSKSSQAVAGRIISALHAFGLHALFVTPNKEIRLLRDHTRSAILIHRTDFNATLTSVSWRALAEEVSEFKLGSSTA